MALSLTVVLDIDAGAFHPAVDLHSRLTQSAPHRCDIALFFCEKCLEFLCAGSVLDTKNRGLRCRVVQNRLFYAVREVLFLQEWRVSERGSALHRRFELANVVGPIVVEKSRHERETQA